MAEWGRIILKLSSHQSLLELCATADYFHDCQLLLSNIHQRSPVEIRERPARVVTHTRLLASTPLPKMEQARYQLMSRQKSNRLRAKERHTLTVSALLHQDLLGSEFLLLIVGSIVARSGSSLTTFDGT